MTSIGVDGLKEIVNDKTVVRWITVEGIKEEGGS
jgi:hypothetical protein